MPKTKPAFALKDFDTARILSRNYFRGYSLAQECNLTDEDYLAKIVSLAFDANDANFSEQTADIMIFDFFSGHLMRLAYAMTLANQYQTRFTRHNDKLMKYSVHLIEKNALDDEIQAKIRRAQDLADRYADVCRAVQNLQKSIFDTITTIKEGKGDFLRRRFSERLRQARKKKGMTQQDLANLIQMSQGGYNQYELARRDPSIPTLVKLTRILNCSADYLLGLTP